MKKVLLFLDTTWRILLGILTFIVILALIFILELFFLPWVKIRVFIANTLGKVLAETVLWCLRVHIHRENYHPERTEPVIFVTNHTSALDAFLCLVLWTKNTRTLAKKELIFVPFLGIAYAVSGHAMINRQRHKSAVHTMDKIALDSKKYGLGFWIWPEGTRSKDGHLQPFKKGFAHFALQTGFPIQPVIVHHANLKWPKNKMFSMKHFDLRVQYLDPIPTTDWKLETLNEHIESVRQTFVDNLDPDQK